MSKRKRYSPDYKIELVELVRRPKSSCPKIALEGGVTPALLTRWVTEADTGGTHAFTGGRAPEPQGRSSCFLTRSEGASTAAP
jgi:transposase